MFRTEPMRRISESSILHHLRHSIAVSDVPTGLALHGISLKTSLVPTSTFLSNHFLLLHAKNTTSLRLAAQLLDEIPHPNVFTYNTLLSAYTRHSTTTLARRFFLLIPHPDVVSYNTLLSAYAAARHSPAECVDLFSHVAEPDAFTVSSLLSAWSSGARQVHSLVVSRGLDSSVSVGNALISSYSRNGRIEDARKVFDEMEEFSKDEVSWNCMIMAYGKHGQGAKALALFREMVSRRYNIDVFTLGSVMAAFTTAEDLKGGMQFHSQLIKTACQRNSHVGSGLVDLYSKSGMIGDANKVFDEVVDPDLVLWNAMIHAYSQQQHQQPRRQDAALICFRDMRRRQRRRRTSVRPDDRTFVSVISACSHFSSPAQGKQMHSLALKMDFHVGHQLTTVSNALIAMYSKFGSLGDARRLFERMPRRDAISFNSMIAGYAQHGLGGESLALFERMVGSSNALKPTGATFVSVLSACAHTGRVEEGQKHFASMESEHGVAPREEHYTCMIDLFGRAAEFERAESFIETMPFDPGTYGWTSLLSSCRNHGNFELGVKAALRLIQLEPSNAAAYVTLSGIYAKLGRWDEAENVRKLMRSRGLRKTSGFSWMQDEADNDWEDGKGIQELGE